MPRVPTSGPRVSSIPLPLVPQSSDGATLAAFGGAEAQALAQFGGTVGQTVEELSVLALKTQLDANERELKNLDTAYAQEQIDISFGDGTPQNPGYYSLTGQDAVDAFPEMQQRLQQARQRVGQGSTNAIVRQDFDLLADTRDIQQARSDRNKLVQERARANANASAARKDLAITTAAIRYNDINAIDDQLIVIEGEVSEEANRLGQGPEELAASLQVNRAAAIEGAFDAAIANEDFVSAQAISERYLDPDLPPARQAPAALRAKITKGLRDASNRVRAQALSATARVLFPDDNAAARQYIRDNVKGIDEDLSLASFDNMLAENRMDDADERRVVTDARADLNHAAAVAERERTARKRADFEDADSFIENGGTMLNMPANLKSRLPSDKQASLELRSRQIASGRPVATNYGDFASFTGLSQEDLRAVDLGAARTVLGDPEFKVVSKLVTDARQDAVGEKDTTFSAVKTFNARTDQLGLHGSGDDEVEKKGRLLTVYIEEIEKLEQTQKRLSTEGERREILDELIDDVTLQGNIFGKGPFFDADQPLFEVKVPDDELPGILATLTASGNNNPTQADINRAYVLLLETR